MSCTKARVHNSNPYTTKNEKWNSVVRWIVNAKKVSFKCRFEFFHSVRSSNLNWQAVGPATTVARSSGNETAYSVLPTAIGLMPPSFLASAHKDAPQKQVEYRPEHGPWDTCWQTQWAEPPADDLHLLLIHWSCLLNVGDEGRQVHQLILARTPWWPTICRIHEELWVSSSLELATENPGRHETGVWSAIPLPWRH